MCGVMAIHKCTLKILDGMFAVMEQVYIKDIGWNDGDGNPQVYIKDIGWNVWMAMECLSDVCNPQVYIKDIGWNVCSDGNPQVYWRH